MTHLFLEPLSGISGDMLNGLLIDLGASSDYLQQELKKLAVDGYHLHIHKIAKSSIYGIDFDVHLDHGEKDQGVHGDFSHDHDHHHEHDHHHGHDHHHEHGHHHHHDDVRGLQEIIEIFENSTVSDFVKEKSMEVFRDIARAESAVHQVPIEHIHFHEVGAIDSIVDIASFFILYENLGITKVYSAPLVEGSGTIKVAHGVMPVPVPAVMQLRKGTSILIHQDFDIKTELITPTGIALLKAIHPDFTIPENLEITSVGYGFGKRDTGKFNALRGSLCQPTTHSFKEVHQLDDDIYQIDTTIDDQTPEQMGYLMNFLYEKGALDVTYFSVLAKKNRPAIHVTLLISLTQLEEFTNILFEQTSTIGFRYQKISRKVMQRTFQEVETSLGTIRVKQNTYQNISKTTLEYEDCARLAKEHQLPIGKVYQLLEKEILL
ncbi:nickel pincer cofactor biosynthesis protein LarC [Granulicatella elegans]|uniref:nickel pincer cofactor biosynthesis protein LarC n=1 Tax=Granulicatella elegans TaxID=137732 RepID=UPI001D1510A5|nr:nickel pincer cofactor biosynthesis protein LarC [Granulicatella elegans]UEA31990.1 nickel pincer cofactor biosynthesis protein LarC [Granulicatella elegans]